MTLTPTAALVEEAEALNDLIQPGPFTKCGEDGDYWVENRHGQKLEEFRDRDMATFFARARTLVPKFATALRRAEAERDESRRDAEAYKRQTQEVSAKAIELTKEVSAKLDQAEAERDAQRAEVLRLAGERDALVFHNAEIEEAMLRAADQRDELTATRDLLTAENARLQERVATLELLLRGGK